MKVWGDASDLTMIRSNRTKELRFNLDPENGTYICNCRWKLSESGNGTKVWFEERYTESAPQTKDELQAQVDESNKMLKRLKLMAEKNNKKLSGCAKNVASSFDTTDSPVWDW